MAGGGQHVNLGPHVLRGGVHGHTACSRGELSRYLLFCNRHVNSLYSLRITTATYLHDCHFFHTLDVLYCCQFLIFLGTAK